MKKTKEEQKLRSNTYYHANKEKISARRKFLRKQNREQRLKKEFLHREANRELFRFRIAKNRYGITQDEYIKLMKIQKCMICGISDPSPKKNFCIDHCHVTGCIRGVLCNSCNAALGHFKDDIQILQKAINYLDKSVGL